MNDISIDGCSSEHIAEYFAVCGLSEAPTPYDVSEILKTGEEIILSESKCLDFSRYSTPIIDIQLVNLSQKERLPDGYQVIDKSVGGVSGCYLQSRSNDDLCICYRRGYDIPPIGDIRLVDINLRLKANSFSITHTIGNTSALIVKKRFMPTSGMYLSYSRLPSDYGVDQLALTDICIILKKKGEVCPLGFMELPQKLFHTLIADDMHICYKKSFVKQYIATYQPEVLMWYHVPLPSSSSTFTDESPTSNNPPIFSNMDIVNLSNFCLPWGAAIESWSVDQKPPETVFFTFVITNASYTKFHGSALTFYEPYDVSRLNRDRCYRLNVDPELVRMEEEEIIDSITGNNRKRTVAVVLPDANAEIFAPEEIERINQRQGSFVASRIGDRILGVTKTLCLVSRFNFGPALKPLLEFMHSKCFGTKIQSIPLERYLAFMFCEIPVPNHRSQNVIVDLDSYHLLLQTPYKSYLTSSPGDPCALMLHNLGPELILQLMAQLLTEQKLLLVSILPDLLVETIQQLITLIHPLRWVLVYIPLIHMRCIHVIQSPSPYLIGVDSRFFEFFQLPPAESADISVIDLDTKLFRPASISLASASVSSLPKGPVKHLRSSLVRLDERLKEIVTKRQADAKVAGSKAKEKYTGQISALGNNVRRACYHFMTELLQDYREFLLPVTSKDKEILFDSEGFVKLTADRSSAGFYASLVGTQLWADFVRDLNRVSERTAELEAFDTAIAHLRFSRNKSGQSSRRLPPESGSLGGGSGETGSQISSGSGGDAGSTMSAPLTNGTSVSPQDSLSAADGSSLTGRSYNETVSKTVHLPPEMLELDPLCSDLSLNLFTWTKDGIFPELVNASLLDELCSRLSKATTSNGVPGEEMETFRLMEDSNVVVKDADDDFIPSQQFIPQPLAFIRGNGVVEVLGIAQLNILLRRTQQETTDCLIAATERRNAGGAAWAEYLLSEVYSLWFLLLPAFITSLQQHCHKTTNAVIGENSEGLCLEARHFLFHVVRLFLRLCDLSLQPIDQVYVRVLIALLYEYGTSGLGVISFWSKRSLNASSYAMANQLQRDLGHKLAPVSHTEDVVEAPITPTVREGPIPSSSLPQTTSTRQSREGNPSFSIDRGEYAVGDASVRQPNKSSSDYNLSRSQLAESLNGISIEEDHSREVSTNTNHERISASSKKGWKSLAQASLQKLASFRVEYINPEVVTMGDPPSPPPTLMSHPRSRSVSAAVNSATNKSVGYMGLLGLRPNADNFNSSARLPRNMLPWTASNPQCSVSVSNITVNSTTPMGYNVFDSSSNIGADDTPTTINSSSSWLQMFQRHLPAAVHVSSPASGRSQQEVGDTLRGSTASIDESASANISAASTAYNPVSFLDSLLASLSYQPPSWHKIAESLAVGTVGDRICPANPLIMKSSAVSASFRGSSTSLSGAARRRRSRSSSLAAARRESSLKRSPSASAPLLALASEHAVQKHARSESPRSSKPPLLPPRKSAQPPSNTTTTIRPVVSLKIQELRVIFTACTPCGGCGRLVYDEEVMAEWVAAGVDAVTCTACQKPFVPRLTVRTVAIFEPPPDTGVPMSHGLIELSVPFLSPLLLRRQLEVVLARGGIGNADVMGAQAFSSSRLFSHRRGRVLLWNLVYLLHRAGLPTHLLDDYPAWLLDAQAEARRLGGTRRVLISGSLIIARALSEVSLSSDLPVFLVTRWDLFPRKTAASTPKDSLMLYRLWDASPPSGYLSPSSSAADLAVSNSMDNTEERQECALDEIAQMAGDCLRYGNFGGALEAVRSSRRVTASKVTLHSVHRELLLLYGRINGTAWQHLNAFDSAYINLLREEIQKVGPEIVQQQEKMRSLRENEELPPNVTVIACRSIFRNLSLT